ncbi:C-type lectin domain family 12 member B-like isoform X2 [Thalassophryne amazonica]|uniref:C-type lectin domain family 12 member B-like isoform X2 n=1 Tax=Thalassophryne amazonica TaxID=390379 RepID=UPI001472421C|nr:C-type lectin domain family 12 member B-like isoform X2 [Thalassophryne amazonica]
MQDGNYATVVFKNKHHHPAGAPEEETVYEEVKPDNKTTRQSAETNGRFPDKKAASRGHQYEWFMCCLGIVCVTLLLGIIALSVSNATSHHEKDAALESVTMYFKQNQTNILQVIHDQKNLISILNSTIKNLQWKHSNLTKEHNELKRSYMNVTAENRELKMQKNILQNMTREWNDLNISRVQWTIDSYCHKGKYCRCCGNCEKGWHTTSTSCYYTEMVNLKTWEEAREECRRKNADLAVISSQDEQDLNRKWRPDYDFWIGLRFEAGSWKWITGTKLGGK